MGVFSGGSMGIPKSSLGALRRSLMELMLDVRGWLWMESRLSWWLLSSSWMLKETNLAVTPSPSRSVV